MRCQVFGYGQIFACFFQKRRRFSFSMTAETITRDFISSDIEELSKLIITCELTTTYRDREIEHYHEPEYINDRDTGNEKSASIECKMKKNPRKNPCYYHKNWIGDYTSSKEICNIWALRSWSIKHEHRSESWKKPKENEYSPYETKAWYLFFYPRQIEWKVLI